MRRLAWTVLTSALVATGACGGKKTAPPLVGGSALADSADQIMFGARFNLTTSGVSTALLNADTAFFFDDNTRVELEKVHMTFYTKTGEQNAELTARRGTFHTPGGLMVARGDVDVITQDGRRLRTEELKFDQAKNEVSSDSAFVLTEPDRRLEGIGFRSDPNLKNVHVLKVLSGTSGTMTIPNQ